MRILVVRYKKCSGIPEGGERASELNLHMLRQVAGEANVRTLYIHDHTRRRRMADYLQGLLWMPWGYYFGLTPRRVRQIAQEAQDYDVVFIDRTLFGVIAHQLKRNSYRGRVVCFFHNVEAIYFAAKYSCRLNPVRWLTVRCADRNDRWSCRYADRTIALSTRDDDELCRRYGRRADQVIPIAFEDRYRRDHYPTTPMEQPPLCMFLGAYMPANVEGIEWFVKNVFPRVNIRMQIVGKGMKKVREAAWMKDSIEVLDSVPNLEPLFEAADIMILPIFKGSGMKVKTCESLMYGKYIIGTPEAWSGYDVDYRQAGACCQTADEFVSAINQYSTPPITGHGITHAENRLKFNAYSRMMFESKYSADHVADKFASVLQD